MGAAKQAMMEACEAEEDDLSGVLCGLCGEDMTNREFAEAFNWADRADGDDDFWVHQQCLGDGDQSNEEPEEEPEIES